MLRELGEVLEQFLLRVAPGEVRVRLREADLRQLVHDARAREGLGEEDEIRVRLLQLAQAPLPEGEGLGVRVVDAENRDALLHPVFEHALQLLPQAFPRRRLEVEGIDVLVLLRRVLGVLHGAVGPRAEPFPMLFDVRVIGRGLESDIERYVDVSFLRLGDEKTKILERAELWVYRLVAALRRADGPRAADVARVRRNGVVLSLARGVADGVYRREVEDVEAHFLHVRQALDHVAEAAVPAVSAHRARE